MQEEINWAFVEVNTTDKDFFAVGQAMVVTTDDFLLAPRF